MLTKLFITATAAAALSVPLAGAAWADPADPDSNGVGQGGVPAAAGDSLNDNYPGAYPDKVPPGSILSEVAKVPGSNVPDGYGEQLTAVYGVFGLPDTFTGVAPAVPPAEGGPTGIADPTIPGTVVKLFTPGCVNGKGPRPTVSVNGETVGANCAS